jgi:hypothetical protein
MGLDGLLLGYLYLLLINILGQIQRQMGNNELEIIWK